MKNIQKQYQDLLEGKMSKANFMRNVRMQFPQHISPVTSYDDSVKILKNKGLLNESNAVKGTIENRSNVNPFAPTVDNQFVDIEDHPENIEVKTKNGVKKIKRYKQHGDTSYDIEFTDGTMLKATTKLPYWNIVANIKYPGLYKDVPLDSDYMSKEPNDYLKELENEGLNEAKQPIGVYGHNPNAETDLYRGIDHVNYYQMYHGLQYELAKMPEISDANYIKARKKVVDNIMKDPDAYKNLQLANFKAVKDMDKDLEMKDVKANNLVDKPNEMKVVKKNEKGNTQDNLGKKEAKKAKNGKGIQHMTQTPKGKLEAFATPGKEKVMALKEHILDELTKPNEMREDINKGSRVKKKGLEGYDAGQVGNVIEFDGDTATVQWDNDKVEHVQTNILTKKDIPQHPKAREKFAAIPDGPFVNKEEESKESKMKALKEKLMKTVKELLYKKGKKTVTADSPQSKNALRQAGYTEVPNTQDISAIS